MSELDVWYSRVTIEDLAAVLPAGRWREAYRRGVQKARHRDRLQALERLCEPYQGGLRIRHEPPLLQRMDQPEEIRLAEQFVAAYRQTLEDSRRVLLDRYRMVSAAFKAVGVGSVGTRCFVGLFLGHDQGDPLFLQVKQASRSVLEDYLQPSKFAQHGERVVTGQRMMQAASDVFLGWATSERGVHFYVRQLWDWKASVDLRNLDAKRLILYCELCARILARAHARSGDAVAIASYIGKSDRFPMALAQFAGAYADQAERDYQSFRSAIASGRLPCAELSTR